VFWEDAHLVSGASIESSLLEEVRDGVEGHVDGGVRQRLDDELGIPWK